MMLGAAAGRVNEWGAAERAPKPPAESEMTMRLTLICHAATAATRTGAFPRDEPLDAKGRASAAAAKRVPADRTFTSPALRARQTAEALDLDAQPDAELRDLDCGRWAGCSLAEIAAAEPEAVADWMANPDSAVHGGESIAALTSRAAAWLDGHRSDRGRLVVVTHAAVMRAVILGVLGAPTNAFWRIDIAPLTRIGLTANGARWALRSIEPPAKSA
jgi:broad specificity phosphatase PhoE